MPPRRNELVTNWLAAYCGDEKFRVKEAFSSVERRRPLESDNGWPVIDSNSEFYRMLRRQGPIRVANLAPSTTNATVASTFETGGLRATLEAVSNYQFYLRGFLVDLANENEFADRVLAYLGDFGTVSPNAPARDDSQERTAPDDDPEFTRTYAGTASVTAKTFVGEVTFSDFACFELHGFVQRQSEPRWNEEFRSELHGFLERLSTSQFE